MATNFDFLITQHSIDGVHLAIDFPKSSGEQLVLVTGGGVTTALYFGYVLPDKYTGLGGLLRYEAKSLAVDVETDQGKEAFVVFPSPEIGHLDDYAELLDRLRPQFEEWGRVSVLISYNRVMEDLPPLAPGDRVSCYWEVRDVLTDQSAQALQYVGERLEHDQIRGEGLQLYTRDPIAAETFLKKKEAIESVTSIPIQSDIIEI